MKRAIIAIAIVAVVIVAGVALLNNINIKTPEPIIEVPQVALPVTPVPVSPPPPPPVTPEPEEPQVVSPVVETPAPVETPPPANPAPEPEIKLEPVVIPGDFIVDNKHWQNAFILQRPDGLKGPRGVGFSDIPIETEIRAPISGYVIIYTARWEDQETVEIIISEHSEREMTGSTKRFFFLANDFDPLFSGNKIQKGEPFLAIRDIDEREVFPGFFDRKAVFAMGFKGDWNTDLTIEDPREFLWVPIQQKIIGEDK